MTGRFPGYHWIYWVGPLIGSLIATFFYSLLKAFNYSDVVLGQDSDNENASPRMPVASRVWHASMGYTRDQRSAMLASGMRPDELERAEVNMVNAIRTGSGPPGSGTSRMSESTLAPTQLGSNMYPATVPNGRQKDGSLFQTGQKSEVNNQNPLLPTHNNGSAGLPPGSTVPGADPPAPSLPLMTAAAQERGGLGAPGAHASGLTMIGRFRKAVRH